MQHPHVCIVGAGIGGASAAWHLRKLKPDCQITVLERSASVGGRLKSYRDKRVARSTDGNSEAATIELGGAIFHSVNETMVELARACDIPLSAPERPEAHHTEAEVYGTLPEVGAWNESKGEWALRANGGIWGVLRLVWRYGLDLLRVSRHANAVKTALQHMYQLQRESPTEPYCTSVEEMLDKSGLEKWARSKFSELGYAPAFVAECLDPIARTIYSRGASAVNGYCGLAAVIAADGGGLYSCPSGNDSIVSKLLEIAKVNLILEESVLSVRATGDSKWVVKSTGNTNEKNFDIVILALPWETVDIEVLGIEATNLPRRTYRQMVVTLIAGEPALAGGLVPQTILSCGDGLYEGTFYSIGSVATTVQDGCEVWKIFSANALTEPELESLFRPGYEVLKEHTWQHCFPDLNPQAKYPPMQLAKGLYFATAMEALAPSMEAAAWCGKNVALMVAKELTLTQLEAAE